MGIGLSGGLGGVIQKLVDTVIIRGTISGVKVYLRVQV
jgi:hypothetical protein